MSVGLRASGKHLAEVHPVLQAYRTLCMLSRGGAPSRVPMLSRGEAPSRVPTGVGGGLAHVRGMRVLKAVGRWGRWWLWVM
jgi:hypothetical protein